MNTSVLQYPYFVGPYFTVNNCFCSGVVRSNPVYNWLFFGRLPENPVVSPLYRTTVVEPSARNRALETVTVKAIEPFTAKLDLAVGGTSTFTIPLASNVVSTDVAVATATFTTGVVTITGVAAGTTTVTVTDSTGNTIMTATVTVA